MKEPILEVRDLCKSFSAGSNSSVEALRNINFECQVGQFVSIVGASGSGKSTLLRLIDGLIPASSGNVFVEGKRIDGPGTDRAMVFQQDALFPWKTVIDNVMYGLRIAKVGSGEAARVAQKFIDLTGLRGFEAHYPHQLSGGMRQRANVARALSVNPKLLLMDEPFAALDAQTREIMQTELLKIWDEERKTVLLVTHQIDEAVFLSDRVLVFSARPGTVKADVAVDLSRPRKLSMKRSAQFMALVDAIWQMIESEVRTSMGLRIEDK